MIFNEPHLHRVVSSYVDYYQRTRTHLSLDKDCPDLRQIQPPRMGRVVAIRKSLAFFAATNGSLPDSYSYQFPLTNGGLQPISCRLRSRYRRCLISNLGSVNCDSAPSPFHSSSSIR